MKALRILPLLTAAAAAVSLPSVVKSAETPARFQVVEISTDLPGDTEATAINDRGDVAGWTRAADGKLSAFVHRDGKSALLPIPKGFIGARALGLNDRGVVVGLAVRKHRTVAVDTGRVIEGKHEITHAVAWEGGGVRELGPGEARDVNNRGEIVGPSAIWRDGKTREPITLDAAVTLFKGNAISENGAIAGTAVLFGSSAGRPALLRSRQLDLLDDSAGGPEGAAYDVNSKGVAVGMSSVLDGEAFLWANGQQTLLGTLNGPVQRGFGGHAGFHFSAAYAVNERAQAVGAANVSDRGLNDLHAVLWERGAPLDLNRLVQSRSGWTLIKARAINDRGEICGVGLHTGKRRAFLLTPTLRP